MPSLDEFLKRLSDREPLLRQMGQLLLDDVNTRFRTQTDPNGVQWAPLSPSTSKKVNPGAGILVDSNKLFGSIELGFSEDSVFAGPSNNLPYEIIQNLGGRAGKNNSVQIPSRRYVGVSQLLLEEIRRAYTQYWFGE